MSSASVSIPPMDALYGERVKTKSQACRFESGRGRHNPLARLDPQRVWRRSSLLQARNQCRGFCQISGLTGVA